MSTYWFILGREPLLSAAEIISVYHLREKDFSFSRNFLKAKLQSFNVTAGISSLGGTVKIATELFSACTEQDLVPMLETELEKITGKITFGFSWYGATRDESFLLETWGKELKRNLKAKDRSVRYIFKNEPVLSSVSVEKNGLTKAGCEFIIEKSGTTFSVARTVAVQPFEALSNRDFGRPGRDSESGMLPPKLALMLINLTGAPNDATLLDPFCGSGTILTEAMLTGHTQLVGTDLSEKAITDCQKNVTWHSEHFTTSGTPRMQVVDVQNLTTYITGPIEAIATEPYLGPPQTGRETETELRAIAEELKTLYLQAFTQFAKIATPGATIVFIIPRFEKNNTPISISDTLVDSILKLGFVADPLLPPSLRREPYLLYRRENQRVAREIWRFTIKKPSR